MTPLRISFAKATLAPLVVSLIPAVSQAQVIKVEDGGFTFTFGGQINRAFLFADDGVDSNAFFVDNDNSSTRLRAQAEYDFGDYAIGTVIEYEFEFSSSNSVSQLNSDISSSVSNERKFEIYADTPYGSFAYGQGDSASNGVSEVDLSGTALGNYSDVGLIAGSQLLRDAGGAFTGNDIGDFFGNFDGNSRIERFRYDTPEFLNGFTASVSFGEDNRNDIALRYNGTHGDFRVRAAVAYAETLNADRISGSVSAFHTPTGLNVTFASGSDDLDAGGRDPGFNYIKFGYQTKDLIKAGSTSFAIDYYDGQDQGVAGSRSESISLFAVQKVDKWNTEFYAGVRTYDVETPTVDFQNLDVAFIGARYRF
ncbi:hypothetical protein [uncultured Tateyamaria sp.]|uniref:hypothetical protein n=1 Tax=uncultured Tateyamaria sp. TaxID=455651 RepID=UPI002601E01F|nr:hypothetical protein [uncultured Tateyamaria sp.]